MPNQLKKDTVTALTNELKTRGSIVLFDYTGLTHHQLAEIRSKVIEAGGSLKVVKNNLLQIALKDAHIPSKDEKLVGPTAVLFAGSEDPSPIKVIYDAGKEHESLSIKWGVWDNGLVDISKIEQLATLPSRDQLYAKLVGSLKSPQTRLVFSLKGNLQKLVIALEEIRRKKESTTTSSST